jgi:hypothetical protein
MFYRCKTRDAKLYAVLSDMISRFITLDKLKEISYGMDTQVNESFNNTLSWIAPKNKVYCGSASLSNRFCMAIGIHSISITRFWTRVFKVFAITVTPGIVHFLTAKDSKTEVGRLPGPRQQRRRKNACRKGLTRRKRRKPLQGWKEQSSREGTYRRGMNMDEFGANGYTEDEIRAYALAHPKKGSKKRKASEQVDIKCKHCGLMGHSTTRSRQCTSEKREKNFFTDGHKNSRQGCWEGWQLAIQLISLFCGSEHVPYFVICLRSQIHTLGTFISDTYTNVWSHRPAIFKPKSCHCPQMTTTRAIILTPICPSPTPHQATTSGS